MKNNLQTLYQNINKIKERNIKSDHQKDYWIGILINNLIESGISSPINIAKELESIIDLSISEKISITKEIVKQCKPELPTDFVSNISLPKKLTISNFSSALSDIAISKFCQNYKFNIINKDSFVEIFDDVYNGRATHCIVPIENTISGKLLNFYSLISNYNLKIEAVCDIEHNAQDATTKFALLSKGPIPLNSSIKGNKYAEFNINIGKQSNISKIITAASELGLSAKRIDSLPFLSYSNEYSYYIVFKMDKSAAIEEFLIFLLLENVSYTPIGIFPHIE